LSKALRTVLLAVYDPLWAGACSRLIQGVAGFCLVAAVSTTVAALEASEANQPELILLEPDLPDGDGFDLIRKLGQNGKPSPRVLILSNRSDPFALYHYNQANVYGLVAKTVDFTQSLPTALRQAAEGQKLYPQSMRDTLRAFRSAPGAFFKILSRRELELLPRLGAGHTNAQIAGAFGFDECTAKFHRNRILKKLDLRTSPELVQWAIRNGFVEIGASRAQLHCATGLPENWGQ